MFKGYLGVVLVLLSLVSALFGFGLKVPIGSTPETILASLHQLAPPNLAVFPPSLDDVVRSVCLVLVPFLMFPALVWIRTSMDE